MRDRAGLLRRIGLGICVLAGLAVLALAVGAALPPTHRLTMAASSRWAVQAPRAVVVAAVALCVSLIGVRRPSSPRPEARANAPGGAAANATVLATAVLTARRITTEPTRPADVGRASRTPTRWRMATVAVAALALAVSGSMTARTMVAVAGAGGSVNPLRALLFTSMDAQPDAVETYAEPGLSAVIYRPAQDGAPVIVYIHGGGWVEGSAADLGHDLRWFAERGWLVVSVDYRLASETHATWDEAHRDVACALVWVRTNAARWGGDADRLAVAGDSAGGTLALNVAYAAAQGRARSGCGGTVPVPDAVVVQYPVADPQDAYANGYPVRHTEPKVFIERYIGGPPDRFPERMQAIAADPYVSASAPPTLVVEPDRDGLIPTSGVVRFAHRTRTAGVDLTLVRIPYANHAFDQMAAGSLGNQASLTIRQHYLVSHGLGP